MIKDNGFEDDNYRIHWTSAENVLTNRLDFNCANDSDQTSIRLAFRGNINSSERLGLFAQPIPGQEHLD